jgi:hypothetical protein
MTILTLLAGTLLATTVAGAQEKLSDLKPLVGKWRGVVSGDRGTQFPTEMTINNDGSYFGTVSSQPPITVMGNLQIVDGKARYKGATGATGTFSLHRDASGKTTLKTVRDDGTRAAEYEPVR